MVTITSRVLWTCELDECTNTFLRYPSEVKRGIRRCCSQACATRRFHRTRKDKGYQKRNCATCTTAFQPTGSSHIYCELCSAARKKSSTLASSLKEFGLTIKDYETLLKKQRGKCAICKGHSGRKGSRFAVDHDHKTGKVRGLLCLQCNTKLGWVETNNNAVLKYLATSKSP
jgi:hypothetical protein